MFLLLFSLIYTHKIFNNSIFCPFLYLIAGWTDHGSLPDIPVHVSKILYVRTDTTDSSLKWSVTITISEPDLADTFKYIFSLDGTKVKMEQQSPEAVSMVLPEAGKAIDLFSFSIHSEGSKYHKIWVDIFRNENITYTSKWQNVSNNPKSEVYQILS